MPFASSPAIENRLRNKTPYSSTVLVREVATRQLATSRSYRGVSSLFPGAPAPGTRSKTPSTVFVLPTSITRSIFRSCLRVEPPPLPFSYRPTQNWFHSASRSHQQEPAWIQSFGRPFKSGAVLFDPNRFPLHPTNLR